MTLSLWVTVAFADIVAFAPALETAVIVVPAGIPVPEIGRPTSPWVNAPDEAVAVGDPFAKVTVTTGFKIHFCNPPSPTVALSVVPSVVQTASAPLEWFFGLPVSATYNTFELAKK